MEKRADQTSHLMSCFCCTSLHLVLPDNVHHCYYQVDNRADHADVHHKSIAERWQDEYANEHCEVQYTAPSSVSLVLGLIDLENQRQKNAEGKVAKQDRQRWHQKESKAHSGARLHDIRRAYVLGSQCDQ